MECAFGFMVLGIHFGDFLTDPSFPLCPLKAELRENLQRFVEETNQQHPDFIKVVRHDKQEGLIRSRVSGWRAATAPIVALFDAHVEFSVGW